MAKKSNNFDNFIQSLIDPNSLSSKTSKNKTKKRKKNPVVEECVKTENSKNTEESILQELENIEESASKSFEFFYRYCIEYDKKHIKNFLVHHFLYSLQTLIAYRQVV